MSGNEYRAIPCWEHYSISRDGEIMTGFGFPLKTKNGKAMLRHRGIARTAAIADLVAEAWPLAEIVLPEEMEGKPATTTVSALIEDMLPPASGRKTLPETPNAALRQQKIIDALKTENEELRKKNSKLERQRDNLAAGRLLAIAAGGDAYGE